MNKVCSCLLGLASMALPAVADESVERPNIVFLLADDQCTYSMGCYGNSDAQTPNLDQLAREGMVFDNHYDTTAICMASRANILTGKYEYRNGCNFEHGNLLDSHWEQSYPMLLRKAGYMTAFAGKIGVQVGDEPSGKGRLPEEDFDRWGAGPGQTSYVTSKNPSIAHYADKYPHSTLAYGAFGRDFIRDAASAKRPFCLSISFKAPHRPDTPDPRFDDVYADKSFAKPQNYGREHGLHFSEQSRQGRQYARFTEWKYDRDYDAVMARYHQQVYGIDVAVGMIREAIARAGVAHNTVIIYTSDNGFLCGSHGYGSKVLPYEESSRVPLIIYDPRHSHSGRQLRSGALTGNIDFAPSILALAGVPTPKGIDGHSLLPLYEDPKAKVRTSLTLINVWGPPAAHSLSVMTKDWKYIYWPYAEGDFEPTEELYWIQNDPLELKNRILEPTDSETRAKMRTLYDVAVTHWKEKAVPYHRYAEYGRVFDPHVAWADKRDAALGKAALRDKKANRAKRKRTPAAGQTSGSAEEPFPAVMPENKPTDRRLSASWARMWEQWNPHEDRGNELYSNFRYTPLRGFSREPNVSRRDPSKVLRIHGTYYVWYTCRRSQAPPAGLRNATETIPGTDWDLADIWFATSDDGLTWKERGPAVRRPSKPTTGWRSICTPDVLIWEGKYYLYFQAYSPMVGGQQFCPVMVAVAEKPDGPWQLQERPVIEPGPSESWDNIKINDPYLLVYRGQIYMYYKGAPIERGEQYVLRMQGVAMAKDPLGPFTKSPLNPVLNSGHETCMWPWKSGIAALVALDGPEKNTIQYAPDGTNFELASLLQVPPIAPGPFIPDAFADNGNGRGITWGLCHVNPDGGGATNESILVRFDCDLSLDVDRPLFKRNNLRFEESTYLQRRLQLPDNLRKTIDRQRDAVDRNTIMGKRR